MIYEIVKLDTASKEYDAQGKIMNIFG